MHRLAISACRPLYAPYFEIVNLTKVKEEILVRKTLHRLSYVLLVILACCTWGRGRASDEISGEKVFRIGYLPSDPEAQISTGVLYDLREFLLGRQAVRQAMAEEGVQDIALLAADSHENLVQRMSRNEFDLVFCSSVDFVTQQGDYEARFQLRRPDDSFDPRGERVFRKGVIFVSNRNPLYRSNASQTAIADMLTTTKLALVSSSAAGYYYPCLKIAQLNSNKQLPQNILFCESSEEAVKTVINGIGGSVSAGACEAGVIEKVLEQGGLLAKRDELVQILLETDPIPADPVALRSEWLPRYSPLGLAICEALQAFFTPERGLPRLENSSSEKFRDLREKLDEFWQKRPSTVSSSRLQ